MNRRIQVNKIAKLNEQTYKKGKYPQHILYLDTGNITKNKINNLQLINSLEEKIPSRAQRKVKENTIIYSSVRPNQEHYGFFVNPQENLVVSTGFTTLDVFDENVSPHFLYYLLTQKHIIAYLQMIGTNSVSAYPSISPDDLGFLNFNIPADKSIQQKIAKVLSDLDAKIELNNKINQELEAMAKTLYDYWFVQFDFPDGNGNPYKSSGGKMVYNEELKRCIPEGWEVESLGKHVNIISGYSFDSSKYVLKGKYKVITIKNVQDSNFDTKNVDYVDVIPSDLSSLCILHIGDILLSLTGNVGRTCLVDENNTLLNQRVGKINCSSELINFMYLFFKRPEERLRLENIATGSSQKNLSPIYAIDKLYPIPTISILKNFNDMVSTIIQKMFVNCKENQQLTELRYWLLPMLMNGQVKVK